MVALILALFLLAFPAYSQVEQRCTELDNTSGATCVVSEPMNTDDYQTGESAPCAAPGTNIDFADSEGAGAKESTTGWVNCDNQFPVATSDSTVGLPTGTSEVSWVMRVDPDGVNQMEMANTLIPSSQKRFCMRHYRKFSTNFKGFAECNANKIMEHWGTSTTANQMSDGGHGDGQIRVTELFGTPTTLTGTPHNVEDNECMNNWCRFEMCIDTTDADIKNFDNITIDGRVVQVGVASPQDHNVTRTTIGSFSEGLGTQWIATGYREDCDNTDPATDGYFYISHAMAASWDTAAGQFIGAACEVEGGCSLGLSGSSATGASIQ